MVREESHLKQYLLGTLGEKEQLVIEQKIMLDDDEFEQLLIAEDELTDAYARQALSAAEREQFEQHFLSAPEHRQKLHFAQALDRQLDRTAASIEPSQPGWLQWLGDFLETSYPVRGYALSAACALLAFGGFWLGNKFFRLQNEISQMRAQSSAPRPSEQELRQQLVAARASNDKLEQALQNSQAQATQLEKLLAQAEPAATRLNMPSATSIAAFVLTPGALSRAVGAASTINQVALPAAARSVKLQLELEKDQYPSYRAVLHTQGGTKVKSWDAVPPQQTPDGKRLQLQIPVTLLPAGSYYFKLEGVTAEGRTESADQFHFRVTRK